jgi:hypothetical protein
VSLCPLREALGQDVLVCEGGPGGEAKVGAGWECSADEVGVVVEMYLEESHLGGVSILEG